MQRYMVVGTLHAKTPTCFEVFVLESVVCRSLRREDKFWLALHQYMRESSISTPPLIPLYVVTVEVRPVA
jgi:hypothetical protein